nr:MAG TPA: hypothetical protein [Caudoviricetes sp.]DAT42044.1 MAG TPA: hypothetical protein [Caudoviricetes sp.]
MCKSRLFLRLMQEKLRISAFLQLKYKKVAIIFGYIK